MIRFRDFDHRYESIIPDGKQWTSATTFLKHFYKPFDPSIADKNVINPESKWYGLDADSVREIWEKEAKRSTDLGTWYHRKMELSEVNAIDCCPLQDNWKYAGDQKLQEGSIYPEFMTYNVEYVVCGQSDRVWVKNGKVNIRDYKSNKSISTQGFRGKKMLYPINHLEECDLTKYTLQLSLYLFMILQHNPNLLPGELEISHVEFEIENLDQWGYPIIAKDKNGDYIVKKVTPIKVPYKEKEIIECLKYLKEKRSKEQLSTIK